MKEQKSYYSIQHVNGCVNCLKPNEEHISIRYMQPITVKITCDKYGMVLSLSDMANTGVQLIIPMEPIQDQLVEVIKRWGK